MTEAAAQPDAELPDEARMTIWEHLAELRTRVIRASIAVAIGMVIGWFLYPYVVEFLTEPYKTIHNGVARLERTEASINRITRYLP